MSHSHDKREFLPSLVHQALPSPSERGLVVDMLIAGGKNCGGEEQASGERVSVVVLREQKTGLGHMVSTVSPSDSSSAHFSMASEGYASLGQVHSALQ
ncbi:hypothetical protein Q7C36_008699 [Tachysurus vachellii]|uniref:Uncharacterized protein n=1 Tax=Tachysurus vachellii TaxID=175792 RepID=A0AA88SVD6_TACVA|nr:hypothetical protein Q7C36_008699 [Tachysurus vachellii]